MTAHLQPRSTTSSKKAPTARRRATCSNGATASPAASTKSSTVPTCSGGTTISAIALGGIVVSAEEAVDEVRRVLALERRRLNHWSRKPERIAALTEALVFSRYFRRFARRLWMREAA